MKGIKEILSILEKTYSEAQTALVFSNPFELLIATILSAQSTDRQVNKITAELFKQYKTPEDFLALSPDNLAKEIKGCGLFRTKSMNIIKTCRMLIEEYNSQVPAEFNELIKLPGVGRKTANVVLSNAFNKEALAVDTHVFRVANRLGLAKSSKVLGVEKELTMVIPKEKWSSAHHWLIHHGRAICRARNPKCMECPLQQQCLFKK